MSLYYMDGTARITAIDEACEYIYRTQRVHNFYRLSIINKVLAFLAPGSLATAPISTTDIVTLLYIHTLQTLKLCKSTSFDLDL